MDEKVMMHKDMAIALLGYAINNRYDSRSKKELISAAIKEIKPIGT